MQAANTRQARPAAKQKRAATPTSRLKQKDYFCAWLFLVPGILATVWLRYYPILKAFSMSFFHYNAVTPPGSFIGLRNYENLFKTGFYWQAWANTLVFLLLVLLLVFWVPLVQALFLNELTWGKKMFTTIYLVTTLIPMSVNVIVWRWIWNPDYGVANQIFRFFGGNPQAWLSDPKLTKFCIIFPGIVGGGVGVLLYLAAMQSISRDIYEAAALDGCTGFKRITRIVLPNIQFVIVIQLVLTCITAMQILDAPFQYTGGGPSGSATSMGVFIYDAFYTDLSYGKSTAASITLFVVIAILTVIQMRLDRSEAS